MNEEHANEQMTIGRRRVLHGALATACSLWAPLIVGGCTTQIIADGRLTPLDKVLAASDPALTDKAPVGKELQVNVQYQTQPNGAHACAACVSFLAASNSCQRVDGLISPRGWCSLWRQV